MLISNFNLAPVPVGLIVGIIIGVIGFISVAVIVMLLLICGMRQLYISDKRSKPPQIGQFIIYNFNVNA